MSIKTGKPELPTLKAKESEEFNTHTNGHLIRRREGPLGEAKYLKR